MNLEDELLEEARETARKAMREAYQKGILDELTPEKIHTWLLTALERDRQVMLDRLMGIDRSFGRAEIKKGGLFQELIEPIMREELRTIILEEFAPMIREVYQAERKKITQSLQKIAREGFEYQLKYQVRQLGEKLGERMAKQAEVKLREEFR